MNQYKNTLMDFEPKETLSKKFYKITLIICEHYICMCVCVCACVSKKKYIGNCLSSFKLMGGFVHRSFFRCHRDNCRILHGGPTTNTPHFSTGFIINYWDHQVVRYLFNLFPSEETILIKLLYTSKWFKRGGVIPGLPLDFRVVWT